MQGRAGFWFQTDFDEALLKHAEWYSSEHRDFLTYFDNWDDLAAKTRTTDWDQVRRNVRTFAKKHHDRTIRSWKTAITATPLFNWAS